MSVPHYQQLIDGQWLLSRDSFCRLLVYGGVYCPAPEKGDADTNLRTEACRWILP